jgi:enterochelin esterase family protein
MADRRDFLRQAAALLAVTVIVAGALRAQSVTRVRSTPHGDGTATVRILAPQAKAVAIRIDTMPAGQTLPLTRGANGEWTGTIGPFPPDLYPLAYAIDGFVGYANFIQITGPAPEAWDLRPVPHGTIHRQWYDSKALGVARSVMVYTPPGYRSGPPKDDKYPVLYLLHGSGGTEMSWVDEGVVNVMLDNLIADKKAVPMIVVMPFGHTEPSARAGSDPAYTGRDQVKFTKELTEEVIPMIERDYRAASTSDRRAIAGLSMGGGQAREIGIARPDLFRSIGMFSAPASNLADARPEELETTFGALRVFFIGVGDQETNLLSNLRGFSTALVQAQIHHTFSVQRGGHTFHVWRRNFRDFVQLLFR